MGVATSLAASAALQTGHLQPQRIGVAASQAQQPAVVAQAQLSGQELAPGRVTQAAHSLPDRASPSASLAHDYGAPSSPTSAEPRKFLQAQPRSSAGRSGAPD